MHEFDHALTVAYVKGRSDERAACIRVLQDYFDKWDGPWRNAAEFLKAAIDAQAQPKANPANSPQNPANTEGG